MALPAAAAKNEADSVRFALEKLKPQMAMALPKHLTPDRLLRVAMTAVQNTPKLLECDRTSLFSAIMACAQLGLEPDGVLGQAYLIPFAGKVQFIVGYKGLLTLARNTGEITSIQAHEVYEGDTFEFAYGLDEVLRHVPSGEVERGEITHFYAYAKYKDGGHSFEVMTKAQVDAIRDKSEGYKNAKKWNSKTPWDDHYVQMGRKTAIRRLANYLPRSVQKAAEMEAAYDRGIPSSLNDYGEIVLLDAPVEPGDGAEAGDKVAPVADKMEAAAQQSTRRRAAAKPAVAPAPTPEPEPVKDEPSDAFDPQTGEVIEDAEIVTETADKPVATEADKLQDMVDEYIDALSRCSTVALIDTLVDEWQARINNGEVPRGFSDRIYDETMEKKKRLERAGNRKQLFADS